MKLKTVLSFIMGVSMMGIISAEGLQDEIEITRSLHQLEKKAVVAKTMDLDEETSKKFWPLYNEYQEAMRKVNDQRVKIIVEYSENYQKLTDEKAEELLAGSLKYEKDKLKMKRKYVNIFKKILLAKQVARYFQTENKIDAITNYGLAQQIPLVK